jgi:hypothetical protein
LFAGVALFMFVLVLFANLLVFFGDHEFQSKGLFGLVFFGFCSWFAISRAITPYCFYDEKGFQKKRDKKIIKWDEVIKIRYSRVLDQVWLVTKDSDFMTISSNSTRGFKKILLEVMSLVRKHNSKIEIPPKLLERLKKLKNKK